MRKKAKIMVQIILLILLPLLYGNKVEAAERLEEEEIMVLSQQVGEEFGVCPELLQSVSWQESRFNPSASNDGCEGLMQISVKWHRDRMKKLGVKDIYDPKGNMRVGADYLRELFEKYIDVDIVLMYYNGDSLAEDYSKGIGEPSEYVLQILELSAQLEEEHGK